MIERLEEVFGLLLAMLLIFSLGLFFFHLKRKTKNEEPVTQMFEFRGKDGELHWAKNMLQGLEQKQMTINEHIGSVEKIYAKQLEDIELTKKEIENMVLILKGHYEELGAKETIIKNRVMVGGLSKP